MESHDSAGGQGSDESRGGTDSQGTGAARAALAALSGPVDDVPAAFTATVAAAFAARTGPRFTLVLSGGPTARACYENLAARSASGQPIDWSLVDVFMGDERVVAADDPDANQRLVREALLDRVGPVGSFTPMPTDGPVERVRGPLPAVDAQGAVRAGHRPHPSGHADPTATRPRCSAERPRSMPGPTSWWRPPRIPTAATPTRG